MNSVIDPSLAAAYRKSAHRELLENSQKLYRRSLEKAKEPNTAEAWLKAHLNYTRNLPGQLVLIELIEGKKRHTCVSYFSLVLEADRWRLYYGYVLGKKRLHDMRRLNLEVSKHCIERLLQFYRTNNVKEALSKIRLGLLHAIAISLGVLPYREYLSVDKGALVLRKHKEDKEAFILTTMLKNEDRLGNEYVRDVKTDLEEGFDFWKALLVRFEEI